MFTGGKEIHGNLRFPPDKIAQGIMGMGYEYHHTHRHLFPAKSDFLWLDKTKGVIVTKIDQSRVRVEFHGKKKEFQFEMLSQTPPRELKLPLEDKIQFRTTDDSGVQFLLIFNEKVKDFRWVLDPKSQLPMNNDLYKFSPNMLLDIRTGFIFYVDKKTASLVLVGVKQSNVNENNHYDGPFDQLGDNYIEDDTFKKTLMRWKYSLKGSQSPGKHGEIIDKNLAEDRFRIAIAPYYIYPDLRKFLDRQLKCKQKKELADFVMCMYE
jgi:hypothetical protein